MKKLLNSRIKKILVCAPHADRKNYALDQWLFTVRNLTYRNYAVFISDNSFDRKNFKRLIKEGIIADYVNPGTKSSPEFVAESQEACRLYALRNGYDAILMLETDIVPPVNVIERLLMARKAVVGAMYPIGFGHNSHLMVQHAEERGETLRVTTNADYGDMEFIDGTLRPVHAMGLGCVMIDNTVLEKIKFRHVKGVPVYSDAFFYDDLKNLNITPYLDTSILCEHNNSEFAYFLK
jgi:hypothetical protein